MNRRTIRADEWLLGRFKQRFTKRQWVALFGGNPVLFGSTAAAVNPILTKCWAYWKLGEASGNRLDSVGTRHMTVLLGNPGSAAGKIGNCVTSADTTLNHLGTAADDSLLAINWDGGFTVAGWIYVPTTFITRPGILKKATGANNGNFELTFYAANQVRFAVDDSVSGQSVVTLTATIPVDTWHFMAGRYNPVTKKAEVSLNGGAWSVSAVALANAVKNTYNVLIMFRNASNQSVANLDEVGLYSYLTDAEVLSLYNSGNGLTHPF